MKKEYIQNGESETGATREHNLNLCAKCIWIISTIVLHFNQMVWDRPHSNDYDSPILNDTAKNDTFLCSTRFFVQILSFTCKWFGHRSIPIHHNKFFCVPFTCTIIITIIIIIYFNNACYILDKTLVLKTIQTLHNAFLNLVNNAGRIKEQKN